MATFCHNVQDWVEEQIEQPVDSWVNQQEQRCRDEDCNWWTLCLNKLFCWLVWVVVKVVTWVLVTVGKWVTRVVCEVISFVLDVVAFVVNLILSIPIIGGILRTIINWFTEVVWRLVGLVDLGLGALGIRPEKKIHVSLLIPRSDGRPITTEAAMMPQILKATELYKKLCNVKIVYKGACIAPLDAPSDALTVGCDASGFFSDWWIGGSYDQISSATCAFDDGWRRVTGYGGEIIIIPILNVTPDSATSSTVGCSFASTHDYVVVEPSSGVSVSAHEMGHACWLSHVDSADNLMFASNLAADPTLTGGQVALVRWSKHCVYF
jgi:hypothetical protein